MSRRRYTFFFYSFTYYIERYEKSSSVVSVSSVWEMIYKKLNANYFFFLHVGFFSFLLYKKGTLDLSLVFMFIFFYFFFKFVLFCLWFYMCSRWKEEMYIEVIYCVSIYSFSLVQIVDVDKTQTKKSM